MRALWPAVVGATALAAAGAFAASPVEDRVIAHRSASGRHVTAAAVTDVHGQTNLAVRIRASPNQRVRAGWAITCRYGAIYARDARDVHLRTPLRLQIVPPIDRRLKVVPDCHVSGDATLSKSGFLLVEVIAHK